MIGPDIHTGERWAETIVSNPFLWDETVLGVDWGEGNNAWALVGYRGRVLMSGFVDETPSGADHLLAVLRAHAHPTSDQLPPVAIESPRRLLVWALHNAGVIVVPLNPKTVKTARGLKNPRNGAKTDPKDAVLIANVLRTNPTHYRPLPATSEHARAITLLHRTRAEAVTGAVRQGNRLHSALAEYHPNAVAAFTVEQMADNLAAYHVLSKALTPAAGAKLTPAQIGKLMMRPGGRGSAKALDAAVDRVHTALRKPSLAYSPEFETAFADTVSTDLEVLRALVLHRVAVDTRLREAVQGHPMWDMFSTRHRRR